MIPLNVHTIPPYTLNPVNFGNPSPIFEDVAMYTLYWNSQSTSIITKTHFILALKETHPSYQVGIGVRGPDVVVFVTFNTGDQIFTTKVMICHQFISSKTYFIIIHQKLPLNICKYHTTCVLVRNISNKFWSIKPVLRAWKYRMVIVIK